MAILRTCDRCDQTISAGFTKILFRKALLLRAQVPQRRMDLCNDCITELIMWLDRGKQRKGKTWVAQQEDDEAAGHSMAES